jgi:opacity protein-like surface antigen
MRKLIVLLALVSASAWPAVARAQGGTGDVHGFAGVTAATSTFGTAVSPTFGGRVGVGLSERIQLVGEAGRLAGISSDPFDLLGFQDLRVRVSAYYGEGGVRFIASPGATIRPYAEATIGAARMNADLIGADGNADGLVEIARNALNRTQRMLGAGGGILVVRGSLSVDIGYRYKNVSGGDSIVEALSAGLGYQVHQVRGGLGFRF